MIMYRASFEKIKPIKVNKETPKQVVYYIDNNRKVEHRELKRTEYYNWFYTFDEAKKFLI